MLFQHAHVGHRHAPVNRFAHVVNCQQRYLRSNQGFHFNAGGPYSFNCGGAGDAAGGHVLLKVNCYPCQRQWMAERDQIAGFFGRHDACYAGNAQHIAFFGAAGQNDFQRLAVHHNAALGNRDAVGGWFGGNVYHVGLALGVKVGQKWLEHHAVTEPL